MISGDLAGACHAGIESLTLGECGPLVSVGSIVSPQVGA